MSDEAKIQRLILDAEEIALKSAPTFLPFERSAEGVRITGSFPKIGDDEEKVASAFIQTADLVDAPKSKNPLIEAVWRIEDKVAPHGIPRSRTYTSEV